MTTTAEHSNSPAYRRRYRLAEKLRSGVPLPMFIREGEGYSAEDLWRHIKIGNLLHLRDLVREAAGE
jgi:hypothetical protein